MNVRDGFVTHRDSFNISEPRLELLYVYLAGKDLVLELTGQLTQSFYLSSAPHGVQTDSSIDIGLLNVFSYGITILCFEIIDSV
jgi:hypothetical protein